MRYFLTRLDIAVLGRLADVIGVPSAAFAGLLAKRARREAAPIPPACGIFAPLASVLTCGAKATCDSGPSALARGSRLACQARITRFDDCATVAGMGPAVPFSDISQAAICQVESDQT